MPADPVVAEQRGEGEPLIASEPPQPEKTQILAFAPSEPLPPEEVVPGEGEKPTVITKAVSAAEAERPVLRHGEPLPPEKPVEEKEKTTVTAGKEEPAREIPPRDTRSESEKLATLKLELKGDPTSGRMFYIQLGAYSDEIVARDLEAAYSKSYPIEILSFRSGTRGLYRVMVGPLNKDESGTVLYWFQVRGFKDAFVRSVN